MMPPRSRSLLGRRGWAVVALIGALIIAGCGSSTSTSRTTDPSAFRGLQYETASAVAFAQGRAGTVFVDGLSSLGTDAHVAVSFQPVGAADLKTLESPGNDVLVGPAVWMTGDQLLIMGTHCPHWSRDAVLADSAGSDTQAICGDTRQLLLRLDLQSGKWSTTDSDLSDRHSVIRPGFADSPFALLGTDLSARLMPNGAIQALDTSSVPKDSSLTSCIAGSDAVAIAYSNGAERKYLGTLELRDQTWTSVTSSDPSFAARVASTICTRDGLLTGRTATDPNAIVTVADSQASLTDVKLPDHADSVSVDAGGSLVASGSSGRRSFVRRGGDWIALDGSVPDGARTQIVVGDQLLWVDNHPEDPGQVR